MLETITYLYDIVKHKLSAGPDKNKILKQVLLIDKVSTYMHDKLKYVWAQQGVTKSSGRVDSRKRTAVNLKLKVESLMNRKITRVYGSTRENLLYEMVKVTKEKRKSELRGLTVENRKM